MSRLATPFLIACVLLGGCSGSGADRHGSTSVHGAPPAQGTAVVTGTTLDAATGRPLAGVEVVGPGGVTARSDDQGRFVLKGLPEGVEGELTASTSDGRRAVNRLRALRNERLEVVLHLR